MPGGTARCVRLVLLAGWVATAVLALRPSTLPPAERLLLLLALAYVGVWRLAFAAAGRGQAIKLAARCTACTSAALLGLALVETPAAVGRLDYRAVFARPTPAWERPGNAADRELVFRRLGNQELHWRATGNDLHRLRDAGTTPVYRTDLRLDRDGFRNPADLPVADVVVVGDSFVEGPHVPASAVITSALADRTGRTVLNLGRAGYGPDQELAVLRRFGLGRRPRNVVWAFYEGNDFGDLPDYRSSRAELLESLDRPPAWPVRFWQRSATRNALATAADRWVWPPPTRDARLYTGRVDAGGETARMVFGNDDHRGAGREPSPGDREALRDRLAGAAALCRSAGARLTVAFLPTKWRVYHDLARFPAGSPCPAWGLDDAPAAVGRAVASLGCGVRYVDLTGEFRREAASGPLLYLADDTHWSAEGHRLAARCLAGVLAGPGPAGAGADAGPQWAPGSTDWPK